MRVQRNAVNKPSKVARLKICPALSHFLGFTCGLAQHFLQITCPSSLAMAGKQLLHDIRNSICYLLIMSARLRSSPNPNGGDEGPRSLRLQEIQGLLPSHNSSLFVLMRTHRRLTQLDETDVLQGHHCVVEQMFSALWTWASCFISRYQTGTLNSKGMIMGLQMALCNTKSIILQRYYGFFQWDHIRLVACTPSLYSTVFIMIELLAVTQR